jgi:hypothetical protein
MQNELAELVCVDVEGSPQHVGVGALDFSDGDTRTLFELTGIEGFANTMM